MIENKVIFIGMNLAVFLTTCVVCFVLTAVCIPLAKRWGFLDYPGRIKRHRKATPFLGGGAVFISFWSVVLFGLYFVWFYDMQVPHFFQDGFHAYLSGNPWLFRELGFIFLGGLVIFVVGLLDDRFHLSAFVKLLGQSVAAVILILSGATIHFVAGLGIVEYAVTYLWIILLMNAFNFIDSLDGHCAGVTLIGCLAFFVITLIVSQPYVGLLIAACGGALLGFLPFNLSPAKVFLGDNGSLFLGYLMAAITLLASYHFVQAHFITPLIPVFVFAVPLYDSISVVTVRLYRGQVPWKGDRNHFAFERVLPRNSGGPGAGCGEGCDSRTYGP